MGIWSINIINFYDHKSVVILRESTTETKPHRGCEEVLWFAIRWKNANVDGVCH